MEKLFKLKQNGTTVKTEIIAGIATFMAMSYILMVNPGFFQNFGGADEVLTQRYFNAVYIATAISAVIGTVLIGLLANLPLAQASGMGLNAYFVFTVCFGLGFTYANALLFVLADGLVFILLTATGLRRLIFEAIPKRVRMIIPAGIGLFIAFIGFQDAGIVVNDDATLVNLASFNILGNATWKSIMPLVVTLLTLILIAVLSKKKVKGAIVISILSGTILYYLLGFTVSGFEGFESLKAFGNIANPLTAFKDFAELSFGKVFTEGFNFTAYLSTHTKTELILTFATTALAFCMVDMFDTMGTLYGACRSGNMLIPNEEGEMVVPRMDRAMMADAIATCTGAICGTSTVTTYVESSAGTAAGGKTGLAAMVTAALFFIAMFLSPIASLIPACAYAAALIYVGILMMSCVKDLQWDNPTVALPSFLTLTLMAFTYNISYGIAFGMVSHVIIRILRGKIKEVSVGTWIITLLFAAMFLLTH